METSLSETVALVTGASRGVGRGVALGLGEAGATVYVSGRTTSPEATGTTEGTIEHTASDVSDAGGRGIAVVCDHTVDEDVETLFEHIRRQQGHLDLLVNNAWGGYEYMFTGGEYTWERPFWEQPLDHWDAMFTAGVRASYSASQRAAPMMIERGEGLIVNISYWAAQTYTSNVAYGVAKAATDRLTSDMAHELDGHGVAVVSLYPGLVRTERVMQVAEHLDLSNSESPVFIGRAVAALAADPDVMDKTGEVVVAATLAREYGFTDVDGTQPRPLTREEA